MNSSTTTASRPTERTPEHRIDPRQPQPEIPPIMAPGQKFTPRDGRGSGFERPPERRELPESRPDWAECFKDPFEAEVIEPEIEGEPAKIKPAEKQPPDGPGQFSGKSAVLRATRDLPEDATWNINAYEIQTVFAGTRWGQAKPLGIFKLNRNIQAGEIAFEITANLIDAGFQLDDRAFEIGLAIGQINADELCEPQILTLLYDWEPDDQLPDEEPEERAGVNRPQTSRNRRSGRQLAAPGARTRKPRTEPNRFPHRPPLSPHYEQCWVNWFNYYLTQPDGPESAALTLSRNARELTTWSILCPGWRETPDAYGQAANHRLTEIKLLKPYQKGQALPDLGPAIFGRFGPPPSYPMWTAIVTAQYRADGKLCPDEIHWLQVSRPPAAPRY